MELNLFSIYDQKAKAFLPPFHMPNKAMAERIFRDSVNDEGQMFFKHPEDYDPYRIVTGKRR